MKYFIASSIIFLNFMFGQNIAADQLKPVDPIEIKDPLLKKALTEIIAAFKLEDSLLSEGTGYLYLMPARQDYLIKKNTYKYHINITYLRPDELMSISPPSAFTKIDDCLLVIMSKMSLSKVINNSIIKYSKFHKKLFREINKRLPKTKDQRVTLNNGEEVVFKDFSEDYVRLHGGKILEVDYVNKTYQITDATYSD